MLNAIIRWSLTNRLLTALLAVATLAYGGYTLWHLPIDVFPDLSRPRVTVLTEAHGLAPEEVETLVTFPIESVMNGATGVQAVRSSSGIGLSIVTIEFQWGFGIYTARQIVNEKLSLAMDRLPKGVHPQLTPISSIVGQVMIIGLYSEGDKTSPLETRTLADWVIRPRLLTVPGVAQVTTVGGGRKQYQVLVNPENLQKFDTALADVEQAVSASNTNASGGYLDVGPREFLVRGLGRIRTIDEVQDVVVNRKGTRPILLKQVARVEERSQVKRGTAAVNGRPAVLMTISKQPGADTRMLTDRVTEALTELGVSLPKDIRISSDIYRQKDFIELSIHNVIDALRDGAILVVIILFIFLMNLKVTFITLTAIPLSLVLTALIFQWFGMSINTMTLGGLAVAIGELVDDAIVDVENILRRLEENRGLEQPLPPLQVVYNASREVRSSIVFSTMLVVLVFVPLFALDGMEGRLFVPLGVAYIVSILASLFVSLTVTPVLSYWLLKGKSVSGLASPTVTRKHSHDTSLLKYLKKACVMANRISLLYPQVILSMVAIMVAVSLWQFSLLGRDFLPPFNEGSVQVNVVLAPGASLSESDRVAAIVDDKLLKIPGVVAIGRRTGRAENDEHADGVNVSEIIISFDPKSRRPRHEIMADIREATADVPGAMTEAEQPLQHLMSEMLSGVKAQIGVKLFGDDLPRLRRNANAVRDAMANIPGVKDLMVEQLIETPQLQVKLDRSRLAAYGLNVEDVNYLIETAMQGRTVSEVIESERKFDLVVRLDDPFRLNLEEVRRLAIPLPNGGRIPLEAVADLMEGSGPNLIKRENVRRRIVVQCNVAGRDLGSVAREIRDKIQPIEENLPAGEFIELGGQYESQQNASRMIGFLSLISLTGMFLTLYSLFRSTNLALQVLAALPMAGIGAVAALVLTNQSLTVASMVGFISLSGIASRNGILLISHYIHLVRHEGEGFTHRMIERAGTERLAPMLMTALTAGIALIPLVMAAGEPGKEILYPVATVILGGLISSTLLDFFVHPALFWLYGKTDAERQMIHRGSDDLQESLA